MMDQVGDVLLCLFTDSHHNGHAPARTYRLDSTLLAGCSEYFKARLQGGRLPSPVDGPSVGWVLHDHVDVEELHAADAVLRLMLTGVICDAASMVHLQRMIAVAGKWIVPSCVDACWNALFDVCPSDCGIDSINTVLTAAASLTPTDRRRVHSRFVPRLRALVGSADAVCSSALCTHSRQGQGKDRLLRLKHASVVALLGHECLQASSENAVLVAATLWASGVSPPPSVPEMRQLAAVCRLGMLSHTFLLEVVPHLAWLNLTTEESAALWLFGAAQQTPARWLSPQALSSTREHTAEQTRLADSRLAGAAAWYTHRPRPAPSSPFGGDLRLCWEVTREQLVHVSEMPDTPEVEECDCGRVWRAQLRSPSVFFQGFLIHLSVCRVSRHLHVAFGIETATSTSTHLDLQAVYARLSCTLALRDATALRTLPYDGFFGSRPCLTHLVGEAGEPRSWEPVLSQGVLRLSCVVRCCH